MNDAPMDVFVPNEDHPIRTMIAAGSGIVGAPALRGGYLEVDYEGNLYGAANIVTYADRISLAYGRMVQHYPTIARTLVEPEALTRVGTYLPATGVVDLRHATPEGKNLLLRWLHIPYDQLAAQLLTTSHKHAVARAGHRVTSALGEVVLEFSRTNPMVAAWRAHPQELVPDDMDCDAVSAAFADLCARRGLPALVVRLEPTYGPQPWYDEHYVTVVEGMVIDWTARQFYNAAADKEDWIDPDLIPCPLIYPRGLGIYPVVGVDLEEADLDEVPAQALQVDGKEAP